MATTKLTVPIIVEMKDIEAYMTHRDIVEVVRCKDCEFYTAEDKWCRRLGLCGVFDADDACTKGERKVDDEQ